MDIWVLGVEVARHDILAWADRNGCRVNGVVRPRDINTKITERFGNDRVTLVWSGFTRYKCTTRFWLHYTYERAYFQRGTEHEPPDYETRAQFSILEKEFNVDDGVETTQHKVSLSSWIAAP